MKLSVLPPIDVASRWSEMKRVLAKHRDRFESSVCVQFERAMEILGVGELRVFGCFLNTKIRVMPWLNFFFEHYSAFREFDVFQLRRAARLIAVHSMPLPRDAVILDMDTITDNVIPKAASLRMRSDMLVLIPLIVTVAQTLQSNIDATHAFPSTKPCVCPGDAVRFSADLDEECKILRIVQIVKQDMPPSQHIVMPKVYTKASNVETLVDVIVKHAQRFVTDSGSARPGKLGSDMTKHGVTKIERQLKTAAHEIQATIKVHAGIKTAFRSFANFINGIKDTDGLDRVLPASENLIKEWAISIPSASTARTYMSNLLNAHAILQVSEEGFTKQVWRKANLRKQRMVAKSTKAPTLDAHELLITPN